jgi:hypothetical protein
MLPDEERAGEALRTLMRDADLPPSDSNVDLALHTGRRRARGRRVLAAGVAASLVTGTASLAAVVLTRDEPVEFVADDRAVSCQLTQTLVLPPGFTTANLAYADRSGRYLVGNAQPSRDAPGHLVLWKDRVPTLLQVSGRGASAVAVNGRGDVIGRLSPARSVESTGAATAWLYRDGRIQDLRPPSGLKDAMVTAINDRGDIAGAARDESGRSYAVVWPAGATDQPRRLGAPGNAGAHAIGDDGTVVGTAQMPGAKGKGPAGRPYVWTSEGRGRLLDVPAGWESGGAISVHGGWVLGYLNRVRPSAEGGGIEVAPVRWQIRGGPAQILAEPSDTLEALGATGWLMANTTPSAWSAPVLISADGQVRRIEAPSVHPTRKGLRGEPIPVPVVGADAVWAQEKDRQLTVVADGSPEDAAPKPGIWRCVA